MKELENQLKPCPLCGGRAKLTEVSISRSGTFLRHTIECSICGLTLEWEQEFSVREHITMTGEILKTARLPRNIDALEAWNRRAEQ